jgi:integrase
VTTGPGCDGVLTESDAHEVPCRSGDIVLIKTLLYTGVRVAELASIRLGDVDLDACRIRITHGKGAKDRYVPGRSK